MNDGNVRGHMPWVHGEMTLAVWANWCLWSLQMMHQVNLAFLTLAAGAYAGGLKAARSYREPVSNGTSLNKE